MHTHLSFRLIILGWLLSGVSLFLIFSFPALLNSFLFSDQLSVISNPILTGQSKIWSLIIVTFIFSNLIMVLSSVWCTFALANKQKSFVFAFRILLISVFVSVCVELFESFLSYGSPKNSDRGFVVFGMSLLLVLVLFNAYVLRSNDIEQRLVHGGVFEEKVSWPARLYTTLVIVVLWLATYPYRFQYFGDHFMTTYMFYLVIMIGLIWIFVGWLGERDQKNN